MSLFLNCQAARWWPYRVRNAWDQARIETALKPILQTAPMPAADLESAAAEVHMLLCRRDLLPGIVALKSLLRHSGERLSVVITNDGTLKPAHVELVDRHIPGARWLAWPTQDAEFVARLKDYPQLRRLYESSYQPSAKLLHPLLASRSERVIVIDPDTAFWRQPELLNRWVRNENPACLHLQGAERRIRDIPPPAVAAFESFVSTLPSERRFWHVSNLFFNSGLLAIHRRLMNLDTAERYLAWHASAKERFHFPLADIWFGPWTPEQTCFLVMFATQASSPQPFGTDYIIGFSPDSVFNHFLRAGLVRADTLSQLAALSSNNLRARS